MRYINKGIKILQAYEDNEIAKKAMLRAADGAGADAKSDRREAKAQTAEGQPRAAKKSGRLRIKLLMPLAVCFCCAILAATLLPFMLRGDPAAAIKGGAPAAKVRAVTLDELAAAAPGIPLPDASGFSAVAAQLSGDGSDILYARVTLSGAAELTGVAVLTIVPGSDYAYAAGAPFDDLPLAAAVDGLAVCYRIDADHNAAYARFVTAACDCYLVYSAAQADDILNVIAVLY